MEKLPRAQDEIFDGYIDDIYDYQDRAEKENVITKFYKNVEDDEFDPKSKTVIHPLSLFVI